MEAGLAEFGDAHDLLALRHLHQAQHERPNDDAGQEVAQDGAKAEALGNGYGDHCSDQINKGLLKKVLLFPELIKQAIL